MAIAAGEKILKRKKIYSKSLADRAVKFIKLLHHTKGRWAGMPFQLQKWQEDEIIRPLFGTVWEDGRRVYNTGYISTARKNGKTELGGAIGLYLLHGDDEPSAEIYSAAGDKMQASLIFNAAKYMNVNNRSLRKRSRVIESQKRIVVPASNSFYRVISADAKLQHGFSLHGGLYDELHVAQNGALWDALAGARGARRQPLLLAFTTAGSDTDSICWEQYDYAKKVLKARKDGDEIDPAFFAYIAETDEKNDDWADPETWKKANPNIDSIPELMAILESEYLRAKRSTARESMFRQFYLNQWISSASKWIKDEAWKDTAGVVNIEQLAGHTCYGGLDLSKSGDITAFVLLFPWDDGSIKILPTFWMPEATVQEHKEKDQAPYDSWIKKGYIKTTPGNVIDYGYVREDILKLGKLYNIRNIAYDRWASTQIVQELEGEYNRPEDDPFMVSMGQGYASMSAPTAQFENYVMLKKLHHGDNPVLTWMMNNVFIERDAAGNMKPSKKASKKRIDGIVAAIMALDRVIRHDGDDGKSIYESRGVITI